MRKRSSYRPRHVLRDPLGYVLAGVAPITSYVEADTVLRLRSRSAIDSVSRGVANMADIDALIAAANMATAFVRLGKGGDWTTEIRAGVDAVEALRNRGRWICTGPELPAIRLMLDIHDAQLDAVSVIELEAAVKLAKRRIAAVGV